MSVPEPAELRSALGYTPSTEDAAAFVSSKVFVEVLLVGGLVSDELMGSHELRTLPEAPQLPSGIYWFGGPQASALLINGKGAPPSYPASIPTVESRGSSLEAALGWFQHLWEEALPVERPVFGVPDHVMIPSEGADGIVRQRQYVDGTWFYTVFINGRTRTLTEAALAPLPPMDSPEAWISAGPDPAHRFAATISRAKLEKEFTDTVFSFRATRTVFRPYQFRPVMKLLSGGSLRLLIADEVGLGKTIEAGLLWTELEARRQADRVLVVCPSTLTLKWRREMEERFGFELVELDAQGLRTLVDKIETGRLPRRVAYVCSLSRLRTWEELQRVTDLGLQFDLIIVDEAHQFRNSDTRSHALGQHLSQWADALVFLSATPVNLHNRDLYNLLELLVPGEFVDLQSLAERIEPNKYLNQVSTSLLDAAVTNRERRGWLEGVSSSVFGRVLTLRPEYQLLRDLLELPVLSSADVAQAKRLISELHGLSAQITRTRKAEVQERKPIRQTDMRLVSWSPQEQDFYDHFRDWCIERATVQGMPLHFSMQMPLRLAGSCLPQAASYVLSWHPKVDDDDLDVSAQPGKRRTVKDVPPSEDLIRLAGELCIDTKLGVFGAAIADLLSMEKQILVFTFSRRTLAYLTDYLSERCRVAELHGDVGREERDRIMSAFRAGAYDVVVATRVASEGLDFEFCSTLINYDLPWNPMEIEQRIGRIDRIGQTEEKMLIVNFSTPGTIETDILERVLLRIGVFEQTIGELEPIIDDMWKDVEGELLDFSLSVQQREAVEQQTFAAIEGRKTDLKEVESAAPMLISSDGADIEGLGNELLRSGRYVGQQELALLVSDWVQTYGGQAAVEDHILVLTGSAELASQVQELVRVGQRTAREVEGMVAALRAEIPIHLSLDQEESRVGVLPLLTASHALVRAALRVPLHRQARYSVVRLPVDSGASPGLYFVLIATAMWNGVRSIHEVWTETVNAVTAEPAPDLGDALMAAIAQGTLEPGSLNNYGDLDSAVLAASARLLSRQTRSESQLLAENNAFAETRRVSAVQVHERRVVGIRQRMETLRANGRSQRMIDMQSAQLRREEQRFAGLLADLVVKSSASLSVETMAACVVEVS